MRSRTWWARVGLILGVGAFGLVSNGSGQSCPDPVDSLPMNWWITNPFRLELSGSYAYLASEHRSSSGEAIGWVTIIDVSDPEGPRAVGRVEVAGIEDFDVSRGRLFVISTSCIHRWVCPKNLDIIDVSDPRRPEPLLTGFEIASRRSQRGPEIAAAGDSVFIAYGNGLRVLDITDPSEPVEKGHLGHRWDPSDVAVEGNFAYVTVADEGLVIIDVSDRSNPREVGTWATAWHAHDLEVEDGFAFVADGPGGLRVIDVTDPTQPAAAATLLRDSETMSVSVAGSLATAGLSHQVVATLDVTDPRRPVLAGLYEADGPVRDVALAERTAYAVTGPSSPSEPGRFSITDLANSASPARLSSFGFRSTAMDVTISEGTTYIASGDTGLYVVDTSDPDGAVTGVLDTPGFASGVAVHGHLALVADGHRGLRIVDVSDPSYPLEIGSIETAGRALRVAALGDHAYIAAGDNGVQVVDFSTPSRPVEVGVIATGEPAVDLAADDGHVFVAARFVRVYDVADPSNPREVDLPEAVYASTVAVDGGLLFAAGNWSFVVYDISEPSEPRRLTRSVGWVRPWGRPSDITVSGHHAFVVEHCCSTENSTHISVFDVLDPTYPSRVGGCRFEAGATGRAAAVSGQRLYVAGGGPDLQVFDLRCLTTYWLEVVAHTSGLHGSQWRSDVLVSHKAKRTVDIEFILHTGDGRYTADASIDKGHQGVFEDIAGLLGHDGFGALEVQASHPVDITSRLYSETDPGTYGAFLRGRRSSVCRGTGTLYGLRQVEGEFRTSIIVTNTTTENRSVPITLYRTDGRELARYTVEVAPTTAVHDSQPFKHRAGEPNLGWGYATVEGGEGVLACATVIDSRTNDALVVPLLE